VTWHPESSAPAAIAGQQQAEPVARSTSLETEAWVPTAQAFIIAGAWGVVIALVVLMFVALVYFRWAVVPLGMAAVFCSLFAYLVTGLIEERRRLLWRLERKTGQDINQDGYIGDPHDDDVRLAYVHDPRQQKRRQQAADFRYFLREGFNGRGTTWEEWDGKPLPSGREMKRPLWETYCERLLKGGLAERPYKTAPLQLVADYKTALEVFRDIM
jgi:hypothetical protein